MLTARGDENDTEPLGSSFQKLRTPAEPWENHIRKPQLKAVLQNAPPGLLKTVKVIKSKDSLRISYRPEEAKQAWWRNVTCYLDGILGQKKDNREKLVKSQESLELS